MNEDEAFNDLAERIQRMQVTARRIAQNRNPSAALERGFHAKGTGIRARFAIRSDIPAHLQVGLFRPGKVYDALIRFSNARGEVLGDLSKDQRGIAIRLSTEAGQTLSPDTTASIQDFLMTNTPVSFARTPEQFIAVGEILLGGIGKVVPRLLKKYGLKETRRILGVFLRPLFSFKPFQMNQYWSRTSFQFGDHAVRFLLRPSADSEISSPWEQFFDALRAMAQGTPRRENYLREKLVEALRKGEIGFDFCVQLFVDEARTPIEAAYIEWKEADAPPLPIAALILPRQEFSPELEQAVAQMAFNPWNTRDFTPLGLINRARKSVYEASARRRGASLRSDHS